MTKLDVLRQRLRPGKVYRREELAAWSTSVDRHLKQLVDGGSLVKAAAGLYYSPKATAFGKAPAEDKVLVRAFLKDDRFLITTPGAYNALGVGTTQLYNKTVVYNHKRHGEFELGGRKFEFRMKPHFPKTLTREFLLVDLVNHVNRLAEDRDRVLARVRERAREVDPAALKRAVREYGDVRTRKFFAEMEASHGGS